MYIKLLIQNCISLKACFSKPKNPKNNKKNHGIVPQTATFLFLHLRSKINDTVWSGGKKNKEKNEKTETNVCAPQNSMMRKQKKKTIDFSHPDNKKKKKKAHHKPHYT
jgi:hypothetical protein